MASNIYASSRYKSTAYPFPDDPLYPSKKGKEFHKEWAEAIFSLYVRDQTGIYYSRRHDFEINRLYSAANQPTTKYIEQLIPENSETHERKGWMDISFDILSVAPKFKYIVLGMFKKVKSYTSATAVDENAGAEKEAAKYDAWAHTKMAPFMQQEGIPQPEPEIQLPFIPETKQELEILDELGTFKLQVEAFMEKGLDQAFYESDWEVIKDQLYEDIFDFGVACTQDYTDKEDQKAKARYLNPTHVAVKYSRQKDFSNIDWWGHIRRYSVTELREAFKYEDYSEADIEKIISVYSTYNAQGYYGFYGYGDSYDYYRYNSGYAGSSNYEDFRIDVLDFEFMTTDVFVHEEGTNKFGEKFYVKREDDYKTKSKKKKRKESRRTMVYKGKWIIGTDYIFDIGPKNDIPREGPYQKNPKMSLNIYKIGEKGPLSTIIPLLDQFQLSWLKLQNSIAKSSPNGIAVEIGALENISLGGKGMSPLDILSVRRHTGDLIYRATTHHSQVVSPNAGKPIQELQGGVGTYLQEIIGTMEFSIGKIRDILGISAPVDAGGATPDLLVGTAEIAAGGTNNVLYNVYWAYKMIKEQTAKNLSLRLQLISRYGNIEGYYPSLGEAGMQVLKIATGKLINNDYAIKLEELPREELRQDIKQAALASMQSKKQGGVGIGMNDYLILMEGLNTGRNLSSLRALLAYREAQQMEEEAQKAERTVAAQAQEQAKLEALKQKGLAQSEALKTKGQIEIENAKAKSDRELEMVKHYNKLNELLVEAAAVQGQKAMEAIINQEIESPDAVEAENKMQQNVMDAVGAAQQQIGQGVQQAVGGLEAPPAEGQPALPAGPPGAEGVLPETVEELPQ